MVYQPQIVVIGAGIVGLSTAYALLEQGMRNVLVLEQAAVNHPRSTSSGISRLLRFEYGADFLYSYMVKRSLELWKDLERGAQKTLYTPTGLLSFGREGDGTREAQEIICDLGGSCEILSAQNCRQRFPQFETREYDVLTYNAEGGILHASTCLQTLKKAILSLGGEIAETSQVTHILHENQGRPIRLKLSSGEEITAERVVVALGPWVQRLLSQLQLPIELTRQYLLYFAGLPPSKFAVGALPSFMDIDIDFYGFPMHKGSNSWLKAASHEFGRTVEPDDPVFLDEAVIAQTVRELRDLLPALRGAELVHVEACIYDVSPDEDFIIDYVPDDPRIVFATGLSGHGFKFGPLLGQMLSGLVCEVQADIPSGRFRLARFALQQRKRAISVA